MHRRRFLRSLAASTLALPGLYPAPNASAEESGVLDIDIGSVAADGVSTEGHTLLCSFTRGPESWKVYDDLRTRDGALTFVSCSGIARVLPKTAEAVFADDGPAYLGLDLKASRIALKDQVLAAVRFLEPRRLPDEVRVTFRVPEGKTLASVTVNGRTISPRGRHKDVALFSPKGVRSFEVVATMS